MAIMKSALERNGCVLQAYCMMTNHFHILLETSETEPGRYKAGLVKDDGTFRGFSLEFISDRVGNL